MSQHSTWNALAVLNWFTFAGFKAAIGTLVEKKKKRLFITYIILKYVLQIYMSQSRLAFVGLVIKAQKCLHDEFSVK